MPAAPIQPRSIRSQMLITVNAVLMTALLAYLLIDYRSDWTKRIADKRAAMMEEARLVAPAVVRLSKMSEAPAIKALRGRQSMRLDRRVHSVLPEPTTEPDLELELELEAAPEEDESESPSSEANLSPADRRMLAVVGKAVAPNVRGTSAEVISGFLRSVCERKQVPADANYQLAVRIGDKIYQAKKSESKPLLPIELLEEGVRQPRGISTPEGDTVIVVRDALEDGAVYCAESLTKMQREARAALLWQVAAIGLIGLGVTAIVDVILMRLVSRPLGSLVATVRRIKSGELGVKAPPGSSKEVESLVGEVNQLSQSLKLAEAHRVRQMDKARRVQERLFPSEASAGPLRVRCVHTAASIVGGDYFDHKIMPDGSVIVILVDVSGHGVPAAMGAAMLKALFDANTRNSADLLHLINAINQGFCEVSLEEDFATIILVKIDTKRGTLQYVNAGHETAYVVPRSLPPDAGGTAGDTAVELREMTSTGPLVGVMLDGEWTLREFPFEPGDRAVLLTDGVVECRSLAGEMLGRKRTAAILLRARGTTIDAFTSQVMADIETFRAGLPPNDDLTLLSIEY